MIRLSVPQAQVGVGFGDLAHGYLDLGHLGGVDRHGLPAVRLASVVAMGQVSVGVLAPLGDR